ncbi:MAG: GrpB family protein, partial [Candidatus Latescibacteria bacterium]|nr:GrpB family protein [Candidatus Latescibacterota bacterium]
ESLPRHHCYVCPETSAELERHLAFRDFLRRRPEYARRLSELKWRLAVEHDNEREAYMAGKEILCREIRAKARKTAVP